ncbi:CLIP-associating protein 1-A-like isoform X3 [Centruroides vittatus]|uniref:CLIP-associating protein 1-A-like isoform X3 n=1 Tax=Centruroides vittatus TaxID=120091 RepID=UPI0035106019
MPNMASRLEDFVPLLGTQDTKKRIQLGIDILTYLESSESSLSCEDLGSFIDSISIWLNSSNFKIAQHGLEVLGIISLKLKEDFKQYLSTVLPGATDRLGDSKDLVREQAKTFILNLGNSVSSPQHIFEKLLPAFSHKNWRVREEILKCLQLTLEKYGSQSLTLSKLMPAIIKLVGDPNSQVRDTAVNTLVEIYRHVGEKVRIDITKKHSLPAARVQSLFAKFDQVQNTVGLLPSASGDSISGHQADDDTDSRSQSSNKAASKRASSAPPVRRNVFATPKPPLSSNTPKRKRSLKSSSTKALSSSSAAAGAADEEMFIKSFEDVSRIQVLSAKDLEQEINKIRDVLSDPNNDWEKRMETMKRLRSLLLGGALNFDFCSHLRCLEVPFQSCIKDLRSQVVREACITVAFLSQQVGTRLDHFAEAVLPSLINLIPNSAKIMSTAGIVTIRFIIQHTHANRLIPILTYNASSKSKDIRRSCCEFLDQLLHTWPTHTLEKHTSLLQEAIKKGINDADPEARAFSRKAFWGFADHFKEQADNLLTSLDSSKQRMLQGELSMSTSSSNNSLNSTTKRSNVYSHGGSSENLSRSMTSANSARRSGIPILTSPKSEPENNIKSPLRSTSAIDLAAATRAKVRARAIMTKGSVASLPRPNTKRAEMSGGVTSPERLARMKLKSTSQSQPSSRPGSPSSKLSYATYQGAGDTGTTGRSRRKSGIPAVTSTSRESSPTRNSYSGLERRGSFRSRLLSGTGDRYSTTGINSDIMTARRSFQQNKEIDSTVPDILTAPPIQRKYGAFEDQSDESETSSVCSDRSFSAFGRNIDDVAEIVHNLSSIHWSDRKEGLLTLQALFHSSRLLTKSELKRITDSLTKLFMDPHTKVFSLFLDLLSELILIYKVDLIGWLYVLFTRLILKSGSELLSSVQTKIYKNLDLIRDSFPCEEQFAVITRFLNDSSQAPNTKAKICLLQYLYSLIKIMDPSEFSSTNNETRAAVSKIIIWTTDHKSSDVKKLGEEILIALFSLNAPEFSILLNQLSKNYQDSAFQLLNAQLRQRSTENNSKSLIGKKNSFGSGRHQSSILNKCRFHTIGSQNNSFESDDTENLNPEEIYNSLKKTTAEIQKYSLERIEQEYNGKDSKDSRRLLGEQQQLRDTASQDSGISQLSVPDGRLDILEEKLEYLSSTDSSPNKKSPIEYNPILYGHSDTKNRFERDIEILQDGNTNKEGENTFYSIVSELNNHNSRNEQRKKALSHLINLTKEGSSILWEEHFRTVLRLLIETIEDSDMCIRSLALRALCELIRRQAHRFHGYVELTIIKILEAHRDQEREVLRVADICSAVAASVLPPEQCVRTLKPIIITAEFPISLAAVKMLSKLVDQYPKNIIVQLLPDIMPALIKAFDNEESPVRKEAVFCTVAIHSVVGDALKPHLATLSGSRMKLLNIYIKRAQAQTNNGSSGSSSNPSSSSCH